LFLHPLIGRTDAAACGDPIPNTTGNIPVTFAALSYAGTLRLTVLSDPAQVPDAEMLTAAMRQERAAVPATGGDVRSERDRAAHGRRSEHRMLCPVGHRPRTVVAAEQGVRGDAPPARGASHDPVEPH